MVCLFRANHNVLSLTTPYLVSDRLAWLNYVQGQLASNLATQLNAARVPFKALRDAETALAPRRALRTNLENQIGKLENENSRAATQRISEVKTQLHRAQVEDNDAEKEILVLKRKALRESEQLKWQAMREVCIRHLCWY